MQNRKQNAEKSPKIAIITTKIRPKRKKNNAGCKVILPDCPAKCLKLTNHITTQSYQTNLSRSRTTYRIQQSGSETRRYVNSQGRWLQGGAATSVKVCCRFLWLMSHLDLLDFFTSGARMADIKLRTDSRGKVCGPSSQFIVCNRLGSCQPRQVAACNREGSGSKH